jgi:hypothetical protein
MVGSGATDDAGDRFGQGVAGRAVNTSVSQSRPLCNVGVVSID